MNFRRLPAFVFAALLAFASLPFAVSAKESPPAKEGPVRNGNVTVQLVARDSSIQPGKPFWVALKMNHDAHWHSYWINAGTGYPTSLTWTLPDGFKAGPIQWPTPHVVKDAAGHVTGNGYENENFLFVEITPPAPLAAGSSATLEATAEWLMCSEVCMPGDAKVKLTLPVKAETPQPNMDIARLFNNSFDRLPKKSELWTAIATRNGATATLRVSPAAGKSPATPSDLHYFDEAGVIDYAAPQTVKEENGSYVIEMTVAAEAPADAAGLKGVLSGKALGPMGSNDGVLVEAPFKTATAAGAVGGQKSEVGGSGSQPSTLNSQPPASGGLASTLAFAFVGGLILNLMPCVFPVLGIKILGFVNQAGSHHGKVVIHGLTFTFGVLLSFWALAGVLLALRSGGAQLGWGFQLQSPAFVFGMAVFLLIFALNMSGLFEVGLAATGAGANLQMQEGYVGSFFTGALATLVATPCSAPFLAPALGAALTLSAVESLLVFTAIGVGLSLPYLLLSIFPRAIYLLPKPGAWMETFKQLMAFPLYATVGWLLWVLAGQTQGDDYALLAIVSGFVLVAMAAWAYGRFGQAYGKPARQAAGRVAAVALLVAGLWVGWPKEAQAAPTTASAGYQVSWEKWSPAAVAAAQAAGKFVYVDFTARWCATCQTNKATVFHSDEVLAEFGKKGVVLLRGDWTNKDPAITAELAKWNRSAVPFNLIYAPTKQDPVVLPELLTPGKVLDALAEAAK
ncbi:MAG TPA: thioredoxin family protein [Candidatus Didemnitutus sp.]|nr:thioredoxin family protein [Candidatus Didemnitutus sp.]